MSRLTELREEELTQPQRDIYERIVASRGSIAGPFRIWLHSPELAERAQSLGEFVRYRTTLEPRLSELAILVVARAWNCQVEWSIHEGFARESGLTQGAIDAVRSRNRPDPGNEDELAVYDFAQELLRDRFVTDETFGRAVDSLGEQGVVELTGLIGYYAMVAMTLNTFEVDLPEGHDPLLTDCPTFG